MKFYRGSAAAARAYVEADHSRADDYYLGEGSGVATRFVVDVNDSVSPMVRTAADPQDVGIQDKTRCHH